MDTRRQAETTRNTGYRPAEATTASGSGDSKNRRPPGTCSEERPQDEVRAPGSGSSTSRTASDCLPRLQRSARRRAHVLDPVGLGERRHDVPLAVEGDHRDRGAPRLPARATRHGQQVLGADLQAATQERSIQVDHPARRRARHSCHPSAIRPVVDVASSSHPGPQAEAIVDGALEDGLEHRLREPAGERVLLARVVACRRACRGRSRPRRHARTGASGAASGGRARRAP